MHCRVPADVPRLRRHIGTRFRNGDNEKEARRIDCWKCSETFTDHARPSIVLCRARFAKECPLKKISVQAYEDRSHPEGGHAILLLQGMATEPAPTMFRLKPVDATYDAGAAGWPGGDLAPVAARATPEGLELVVGPDVTDSELLLPGIVVEIEVPEARVRGEFLWPNVAPQLRQRRRHVVINRPRRGNRLETASRPEAKPEDPATAATNVPDMPMSEPSEIELLPVDAVALQPDITPAETPSEAIASAAASRAAAMGAVRDAFADDAAAFHARRAARAAAQAAASPSPSPESVPLPRPRPASPQPVSRVAPPMTQQLPRADHASDAPWMSTSAPRRSAGSMLALQALVGLLAGGVALYVLSRDSGTRPAAPSATDTPASGTAASPPIAPAWPFAIPASRMARDGESTLYDTLAAGPNSPRGVAGGNVSPAKAIDNANAQLASGSRDTEEAGYWLKRYITGSFSDERTVRALTQLGSVYAEPGAGRAPDYAKARQLWEIASASGDAVAMCFVGLLHENGLGTGVDKKTALRWYERSKAAGGCPQVDESIARVRQ